MTHALGETIMDSILLSVKHAIGGLDEKVTHFDSDLIMFINSAFTVLAQLGVGPETPFKIEDSSTEWSEFEYNDIEAVKEWMFIRVKTLFDPPINGSVTQAYKERQAELEWRMNVMSEEIKDGE